MPQVSIITPCYNSERYVGATVESVRGQTLLEWEHVLVDDGSTDGSAAVVARAAAAEPRLRLVRQPNGGVASARNRGFREASPESRYLLFLDADDCLEPSMLERMVAYLEEHPEAGMAYCSCTRVDAEGEPLDGSMEEHMPRYVPSGLGVGTLPPEAAETPFVSVFNLAGIIPSLSVIRRAVYESTPGWDEGFGQHYEDTDLFLHVALRSKIHHVPERLVRHRRHAAQSSADTRKFEAQERKLYVKWRRGEGLTHEEKAVVEAAWSFRQGRLVPWIAARAAREYLTQGKPGQALRFYVGAARRYLAGLPSNFNLNRNPNLTPGR